MTLLFDPAPTPIIGLANSDIFFPVHRIYCIGRNYAEHAREMGIDPDREPPFFFCKPADATLFVNQSETGIFPYPKMTEDCQYEVELVAAIGKAGANISVKNALEYVYGYAIGLDMTRRDLQLQARNSGRPWELGKAFDLSAPVGPIYAAEDVGHLSSGRIWLEVNGAPQQNSDLSKLIWSVAEAVAYLSKFFALRKGDLLFTGTPEGVGPVTPGSLIRAGIDQLGELSVQVS